MPSIIERAATVTWAASVQGNSKRLTSRADRLSTKSWELHPDAIRRNSSRWPNVSLGALADRGIHARPRIDLKAERASEAVDGEQEIRGTKEVLSSWIDSASVASNHPPVEAAGLRVHPAITIETPDLALCLGSSPDISSGHFFTRSERPSAQALETSGSALSWPGILSQPPFSMNSFLDHVLMASSSASFFS
jgi:hypothetical protein